MNVVRFQFEIEKERLEELEWLAGMGELKTKKDLLNNAITLLKWAVRQRINGRAIASVDEEGNERELEMPFLEAVAANAKTLTKKDRKVEEQIVAFAGR